MTEKNSSIQGPFSISGNLTVGGNSTTRGNAKFEHNLEVKGWLKARNIVGPCKGLFASETKLNSCYPKPENGWWALVGNTLPAEIYRAEGKKWIDTGEQGGEIVPYLDELEETVSENKNNITALQENKQNNLTFDDTPKENSLNPVKSGGIKKYVDSNISYLKENKQDELTFDSKPTYDSNNPVTSNGIKTALDLQKSEVNEAKNSALSAIRDSENNAIANLNSQKITPEMLSESTKQLIEAAGGGTINNLPDDEDLTSKNIDGAQVLKFNDKPYNKTNFSGLGRKYLRKNIQDGKNVLTQDMLSDENTIYIIQYDYDLNGAKINIPENCVLKFEGGSISNGTLVGNNTIIDANLEKILLNIACNGTWNIETSYPEWFDNTTTDCVHKAYQIAKNCCLTAATYNVESSIKLGSNKRLYSLSMSKIIPVSDIIGGVLIANNPYGISNSVVEGINIDNTVNNTNSDIGIYLDYFTNKSFIKDVGISGFIDSGLYITRCWYAKFSNIQVVNCRYNIRINRSKDAVNCIEFRSVWSNWPLLTGRTGINLPLYDDAKALYIEKDAGLDISFSGCTFEGCKVQNGADVCTYSVLSFNNCYFENCPIKVNASYNGAGIVNFKGCYFTGPSDYYLADIDNIAQAIFNGVHYGASDENVTNKSFRSDANLNIFFGSSSGKYSKGSIETDKILIGNTGDAYADINYRNIASRLPSALIQAVGNRGTGKLEIGRNDIGNLSVDSVVKYILSLSGKDLIFQRTKKASEENEESTEFHSRFGDFGISLRNHKGYGSFSTGGLLTGSDYYATVDDGKIFSVKYGTNVTYKLLDGTAEETLGASQLGAVITAIRRKGTSSEEKILMSVNNSGVIYTFDNNGNQYNSDGTLFKKVSFTPGKDNLQSNYIFKVTKDLDLDGGTLNVGENVTLDFCGGKIINGTINLNGTKILPNACVISDYITASITGTYKKGQCLYDTDINKPKWWDGSKWIDGSGNEIL